MTTTNGHTFHTLSHYHQPLRQLLLLVKSSAAVAVVFGGASCKSLGLLATAAEGDVDDARCISVLSAWHMPAGAAGRLRAPPARARRATNIPTKKSSRRVRTRAAFDLDFPGEPRS